MMSNVRAGLQQMIADENSSPKDHQSARFLALTRKITGDKVNIQHRYS